MQEQSAPYCPSLPSSESVARLVSGDPLAIPLIARDLVTRAAMIGAGMYIAGQRENLVRNALAGSAAIESFVILWVFAKSR